MVEKIEPYKGISNIYDEIRPSYPDELIQDIIIKTNIKISDKLLEIGAGTGKATVQFAKKGYNVHAIELGIDMADILKLKCDNYPNVSIDVDAFETWNSPKNQKYDMIYSAQAFHWLDINIKYTKCHELLTDKGFLVLFWYNASDYLSSESKLITQQIDKIIKKYSDISLNNKQLERRTNSGISKNDERKAEILASGLFDIVKFMEYKHEVRNNAKQYLKVLKSIPTFASTLDKLDNLSIARLEQEIEEIINNNGGTVGTIFNFSLFIMRKI